MAVAVPVLHTMQTRVPYSHPPTILALRLSSRRFGHSGQETSRTCWMEGRHPLLPTQDSEPLECPEWQKEDASSHISSNKNNARRLNVFA